MKESHASDDVFFLFFHDLEQTQSSTPQLSNAFKQSDRVKSTAETHNLPNISPDTTSNRSVQRRRKTINHRRNNSKGSVASWGPPSLSEIAKIEAQRSSIVVGSFRVISNPNAAIDDQNESIATIDAINPIPSISAGVDSDSQKWNEPLDRTNLTLDLGSSSVSYHDERKKLPSQRTLRALSSSDRDEDENQVADQLNKSFRRRYPAGGNIRTGSVSSSYSRSNKEMLKDQTSADVEDLTRTSNAKENEKCNDSKKTIRTVSFQHNPSNRTDRSTSFQSSKTTGRVRFTGFEISFSE